MDRVETISAGEAAELLKVSRRRVTGMASAGELPGSYQDQANRWRVPRSEVNRLLEERRQDPREKPGRKPPEGPRESSGEMVEELRDQVRYLRSQLDQERQAHAEARRIIGGLVQRVPELEAASSSEATEADVSPGPTRTPTDAPGSQETTAQRRPWWRRVLGG